MTEWQAHGLARKRFHGERLGREGLEACTSRAFLGWSYRAYWSLTQTGSALAGTFIEKRYTTSPPLGRLPTHKSFLFSPPAGGAADESGSACSSCSSSV